MCPSHIPRESLVCPTRGFVKLPLDGTVCHSTMCSSKGCNKGNKGVTEYTELHAGQKSICLWC